MLSVAQTVCIVGFHRMISGDRDYLFSGPNSVAFISIFDLMTQAKPDFETQMCVSPLWVCSLHFLTMLSENNF